jgi:modulator of FtsH protease HflK
MSSDHDHSHPPTAAPPPGSPEDATGQALSEALRSSFVIIKILMAGLVLFFLCSGMFTVGPQERAMILRFGKPVGAGDKALLGPGFHWAFPAPIDEVIKIPAGQVRTATSSAGWYATTPEKELAKNEPPPGDSLKPGADGYVLTADANIIHVRAALRYRIVDPVRFEFGFLNAARFITNALNDSLNYAAAHFTVDRILTRDVTSFREQVRARLNYLIDQERLGIVIEQCDIQARAPRQERVARAFNAVTDAGLKSGQVLNEARGYANEVRSRALGEAASLTNAAMTEKTRLVESVGGEAKRFASLLPQYEANRGLFTLQRQAETLGRVFTNAYEKFFVAPGAAGQPREIRLLLSREPEKSAATLPPPPPAKDEH